MYASYFECFSVTVPFVHPSHPKLKLVINKCWKLSQNLGFAANNEDQSNKIAAGNEEIGAQLSLIPIDSLFFTLPSGAQLN